MASHGNHDFSAHRKDDFLAHRNRGNTQKHGKWLRMRKIGFRLHTRQSPFLCISVISVCNKIFLCEDRIFRVFRLFSGFSLCVFGFFVVSKFYFLQISTTKTGSRTVKILVYLTFRSDNEQNRARRQQYKG